MSWIKKLFGGKAAPATPHVDEKALALAVRHKLLPYANGLRGVEELFVPIDQFLTVLEMRAAGSATMRLLNRPETVWASARIALQCEVMKGGIPFFYKDNGNSTVFVSDVKLRARDLADHAGWLVDRGQVTLASMYAQALEDMEDYMQTYATLSKAPGLSYNDGKDLGRTFEVGADEDSDHAIQPVLRRKNNGIRPS